MLDLLRSGFLPPDAFAPKADRGQSRGLEAHEGAHFTIQMQRRGDGPGDEVRIDGKNLDLVFVHFVVRRGRKGGDRGAGEPDGVALLQCGGLVTSVVRRAGDHHVANPGQDLVALGERALIEVVGQMPGQAPALGGRHTR